MNCEDNSKVFTKKKLLPNNANDHKLQVIKTPKNNAGDFTDNSNIRNRSPVETMKLTNTKKFIIFGISWITLVVGLILGNFWTQIVDKMLDHELVLSPTSGSYSMWKKTPIPMYTKFYIFNWTNFDEYIFNNTKPRLQELGPYTFREVDYKVNQVFHDNGTITFNQKRMWFFEESMSVGSLNDTVTTLNPVTVTLGYKVRNSKFAAWAVDSLLNLFKESLTKTKIVGEILFDGYEDQILKMAHKLNISTGFPDTKFGWFHGRNASETYDGIFNILTGSKNIFEIGILQEWNYKNKSDFYSGSCSAINGTLGDLLPPLVHNESLPVFAPDICTLIHLQYSDTIDYHGISGKKFVSTQEMLDNGTNVPSRRCYCENVECQPSGTLNVSTCKFGAPAFISLPHFYLGDESYLNAIDGLKPDKSKHEFWMTMQPDIGTPLQVRARTQLNLLLQPIHHIKMFKNVSKIYMPILWFTQEANLSESYTHQIKFILMMPLIGHVTLFSIAGFGILLFLIGICLLIRERGKSDDVQNLIPKSEENNTVNTVE